MGIDRRRFLASMGGAAAISLMGSGGRLLWAQAADPTALRDPVYICPMLTDRDIRSHDPGTCPRCGMKLVAEVPDPVEYRMNITADPRMPAPGVPAHLTFTVQDPWKGNPVTKFQIVHEKLFHAFIVSGDLQFFLHDHPALGPDGAFHYELAFPKPGMYRVLGDFYPDGATPQLIAKTIYVSGAPPAAAALKADYSTKNGQNMQVELVTAPSEPIAGQKTQMLFRVKPGDDLEKYLGAWGHLLAASDDLIDLNHQHPLFADDQTAQIQFNLIFPRARMYRVWVQFQRSGVVNTVHFDVPVRELR